MELEHEIVSTDRLTNGLTRTLRDWAGNQPGRMSVHRATDPWNVLELIDQGPQDYRLVVAYAGDEETGDDPFSLLVVHRWDVYVSYPLGLHVDPARILTDGTPERPALLRMLDEVKAFCLALRWPEELTETLMRYGGTEPATLPDGLPLAAYRMRLRLTAAAATAVDGEGVEVDLGGL